MSRQILVAVGDMIFTSKVDATARQVGVIAKFARTIDKLLESARKEHPDLILLDLNNPRFDPLAALRQLKTDDVAQHIPIIGFLSHVQVELRQQAMALGCNFTLPRSEFTHYLSEILLGDYPPSLVTTTTTTTG